MGVADLMQKFQFVVDSNGEKQAVLTTRFGKSC